MTPSPHRYEHHPAYPLIQEMEEFQMRERERERERESDLEGIDVAKNVDSVEEGRKRERRRKQGRGRRRRWGSDQLVKRPSLLSVIGGHHWSEELTKRSK